MCPELSGHPAETSWRRQHMGLEEFAAGSGGDGGTERTSEAEGAERADNSEDWGEQLGRSPGEGRGG